MISTQLQKISTTKKTLTPVREMEAEFKGASLGDKRWNRALAMFAARIAQAPSRSFPNIFSQQKELEKFYRFVRCPYFDMQDILEEHYKKTALRCQLHKDFLIVHDTTEFSFDGDIRRTGLGRLRSGGQGFFGHFSIAVSADGTREPLGVLNVLPWTRALEGQAQSSQWPFINKEQERWNMGISACKTRLEACQDGQESVNQRAIQVADREGDDYEILTTAKRFVIRICQERNAQWSDALGDAVNGKMLKRLRQCQARCQREVKLSPRSKGKTPSQRKHFPAREGRLATLHMSGTKMTIQRPINGDRSRIKSLDVNVVRVWEPNAPEGEKPVEWLLITSEPIETTEDLERVVDIYRARWLIEEYFKSIKTGCAFKKRQLASLETLQQALGVLIPVAWSLLVFRHLSRHAPDEPADRVLSAPQLAILNQQGRLSSSTATVREALMAVASLGGHIKNNGNPGWQVLGRGYSDLLLLEQGYLAAQFLNSS